MLCLSCSYALDAFSDLTPGTSSLTEDAGMVICMEQEDVIYILSADAIAPHNILLCRNPEWFASLVLAYSDFLEKRLLDRCDMP